ncbi:MAG TPA: ABC transporter ATP-binding protein [Acidimicrobiales bacterium]|nr:ABC transporter ATP-binding protein [Acidimicrobiales bacterium]
MSQSQSVGGVARSDGWRLLRRTIGKQKLAVSIGVTAGIVWTLAKVALPTLAQKGIDQGIVANEPGALRKWSVIIVVVAMVSAVCTGLRRFAAFGVAYRAETDLRLRLFAHLQRLHFAYHDRAQTGQLMSRAATDLQQIQSFVVMIPITISNALQILLVAILLLITNLKLAIVALAALPLLNVMANRFSKRIHPVSMELQQELAGVSTSVEEAVTGIRVVKGFGAEALQSQRLKATAARVLDRALYAGQVRAGFMPLLDFIPQVGIFAIVLLGGHDVLNHSLSLGNLVKFLLYVNMLIFPLRMTGQLVAQGQRAVAASQRVEEILVTEALIVDAPNATAMPPGNGEIRFEHVSFGYSPEAEKPVLADLSLTIHAGEAVAIVGPTGCGKTTVARLLPRFYEVTGGSITIDGADVRTVKLSQLRTSIGIVFEDTFLFGDSVAANIAFADPDATQERIEAAAALAGAHDFIRELPDGYATEIGERGFSLSGGQRQRIALARAILADPRVLILDDATSSVDPTKEHEIRDALKTVMEGRTTIVIAHRPATIALADRVVLLDDGRIIAEGTHTELLATSERYRQVLAQAEEVAA